MQRFLNKYAFILLVIAVVVNAATAFAVTALTEPPAACSNPYYQHQALGDWDTSVACSDTERNIEALVFYFVLPFFYLGFITLGIIASLFMSIIQRKRLSWDSLRTSAVLLALMCFISTVTQLFFFIAA